MLTSWKEIAAYLNKGVRTVQRWEVDLALPVRRPVANRSVVIALTEDIDAWVRSHPVPKRAGHEAEVKRLRSQVKSLQAELERLRQQVRPLPFPPTNGNAQFGRILLEAVQQRQLSQALAKQARDLRQQHTATRESHLRTVRAFRQTMATVPFCKRDIA